MREFSKVDLGSIQVHKKVLADIAATAIGEIDGIRLVPQDLKDQVLQILGQNNHTGVTVSVDKAGQVSIDVKILVRYGLNIPDVARHTQDVVRSAVEKTVDIVLKDISVNVQGIDRVLA